MAHSFVGDYRLPSLGSLTDGYGIAYSSSALLELAELQGEFAFERGGVASELFAV